MSTTSKAIITVIGKDAMGIIAKVSGKCSECGVNILDITQKVFGDTFAMIMQVETNAMTISFVEFTEMMKSTGKELGVVIHATHEDIFNAMHRV